LVRKIYQLVVLERHKELVSFSSKQVTTSNLVARYYVNGDTNIIDNWMKLSIQLDSFNTLYFHWIVYENELFQKWIDQGTDYSFFKMFICKYKEKGHLTLPWLLGFSCKNIKYLQTIVHKKYPNLFSDFNKIIHTFKKENTMIRALERKSREIEYDLKHKPNQPHNGIIPNLQEKILSPKITQALWIKHNEALAKLYNKN
ncbi:3310_t:CDS:2, partial [Dentiscutata heterogama]